MTYEIFIRAEARLVRADGCTGVSEWNHDCCLEHDLACFYGRDPRSAYAVYSVNASVNPWMYANTMSRRQADYAFLRCNRCRTKGDLLGRSRAWVRFLGVRLGAMVGIGVREASHDRAQSQRSGNASDGGPHRSGE